VHAAPGSRALRRLLMEEHAGIVHAHSGRAHNLATVSALGLDVRKVVTRHVAFAPRHPLVHKLKYSLACDGIIAVSQPVRAALIQADVPSSKIEVIHTGIEIPLEPPDEAGRRAARERFGFPADCVAAGHMGAFTSEKGQDVAIDAVALCELSLRIRLALAGEGPLGAEMRKRAASLPITFLGFVEDRAAFYAALDLFIMPSKSEAWGLAALEAMAYGVPVVASNVGGLAEMIEHGSGGWLVPPGDPQALAEAITLAASERSQLREAGSAARRRARLFSAERTAERTEAFYRRLLEG
jgi:glycosyltransferase involved in cell wall biosynthesis